MNAVRLLPLDKVLVQALFSNPNYASKENHLKTSSTPLSSLITSGKACLRLTAIEVKKRKGKEKEKEKREKRKSKLTGPNHPHFVCC